MYLLIDAGNTNIVAALADDHQIVERWRLRTEPAATADDLAALLLRLLDASDYGLEDISRVAISNVVPPLDQSLARFCNRYLSLTPLLVSPDLDLGLRLPPSMVRGVGSDRLVNAAAALWLHQQTAIVIDFGTATTLDVVTADGSFLGGLILPGPKIFLDSLLQYAPRLPQVQLVRPEKVIGDSTITSLESGLYWGNIAIIEGLIARIRDEISNSLGAKDVLVLATGGVAKAFEGALPNIDHWDPDLTLKGLRLIHRRIEGG